MEGTKINFSGICLDSLSPVKILLTDLMKHLELNHNKFIVFAATPKQEMEEFLSVLIALDSMFTLNYCDKISAKNLSHHTLSECIGHCCRQRHCFLILFSVERLIAPCVNCLVSLNLNMRKCQILK